ncbi:MAG: hypothetical protein AB1486_12605 [Planctomycetota bacterium]
MSSNRIAPWTREELEDTLARSSPFVRYLLFEVSQQPAVPVAELKSPNAAAALIKRIANRAGREPLILRSEHSGQPTYSLNPNYRGWIREIVKDASALPEAKPRKKPASRPPAAAETGAAAAAPAARRGRPRKVPAEPRVNEGALLMPRDLSLEFCRSLATFLNSARSGARFRIVLDGDRCLLERS